MNDGKNVSMRDVGERAGVTAATVSLVLRNSPLITDGTKMKVRAAVSALGYRPHPHVQSLMRTRRARKGPTGGVKLALVTAFPTRRGWREDPSPMFRQLFDGATERASRLGYRMEEFWLHEKGMSGRRFSDVLRARGIHGVLVAPLPEPGMLREMEWEHFATVALGFTLTEPAVSRVAGDHFHSMLRLVEECRRLGYRRMGLALSEKVHEKVQRRWLGAYMLAQRLDPEMERTEPLLMPTLTRERFDAWVKKERPELVITASSAELVSWLEASGHAVPETIGVASLSAPEPGGPLSGIHQNFAQIGRRAIDLLVAALERNETGVPQWADTLLVEGVWNPGATVATRHDSPASDPRGRKKPRSGGAKKSKPTARTRGRYTG